VCIGSRLIRKEEKKGDDVFYFIGIIFGVRVKLPKRGSDFLFSGIRVLS
jgi:hypothetical protein